MQAPVAEVLGDAGRQRRAVEPLQGRIVGRSRHHHCPGHAFGAKDFLNKFLHFTATFADQPDHHHIGVGEAGHHPQQYALADPGAGEQAHPLTAPDRQQGVDRPHSDIERFADRLA